MTGRTNMRIIDSVNDKNILKAVFLAGGPGSGKSFVANQMFGIQGSISPFGVKVINSDYFFELGLVQQNLPKVIDMSNKVQFDKQMVIRGLAKAKAELKKGYHIDSLLPIIIDGTGKDAAKIIKQANFLKSKGYDVAMVFVNTSLQVSLERNNARERKVDPGLVEKMWTGVQQNIGMFQKYFGNNEFLIVDNNTYFEKGSIEAEAFLLGLFKSGKKLMETPLRNPIGLEVISVLRQTGGKYLSDLPEDFA